MYIVLDISAGKLFLLIAIPTQCYEPSVLTHLDKLFDPQTELDRLQIMNSFFCLK